MIVVAVVEETSLHDRRLASAGRCCWMLGSQDAAASGERGRCVDLPLDDLPARLLRFVRYASAGELSGRAVTIIEYNQWLCVCVYPLGRTLP